VTVFVNYDTAPPLVTRSLPTDRWKLSGLGASGTLAKRLQGLYHDRLTRYKQDLADAGAQNAFYRVGGVESGFPYVELLLHGQKQRLPIDDRLYTALYDLYTVYGWDGLDAVRQALTDQITANTPDDVLMTAWWFFVFTRNLLAVLIRETLIELEAQAAQIIFGKLGEVQQKLSAQLMGDFAFDYTPPTKGPTYGVEPGSTEIPENYKMRKRAIATSVYEAMKKAVDARTDYEALVARQEKAEKEAAAARQAQIDESGPGYMSPSTGDDSASERLKRAARELGELPDQLAAAYDKNQSAQDALVGNTPFAALPLPGLQKGFKQEDMENALGKMLTELARGIDEVAAATKPGDSRIKRNLVGLPEKWLNDTTQSKPLPPMTLERLYLPQMRFETDLVSALNSSAGDDPAVSWMLEPRSWAYLLLSGTIEPGSFQDIVIFQWVRGIVTQRQASAKARIRFTQNLRICAAVLGLAMFVFPPAGLLALAAAVAVTADHIHYSASQLAELDHSLRALLPNLGSDGQQALAEIGSLYAARPKMIEGMTKEALIMILTLGVAQIRVVGEALLADAFFNDSMTLIRAADPLPE